jgi:polyhydroxyalkanoate synthesis regulator protein
MQSMVPQYLEASMDAFRRNQTQFRAAMEGAFAGGPFAEIAKRNMDMFEAAASAFKLKKGEAGKPMGEGGAPPREDEVAALKAQLAGLQAKIDKLSG